MEEKVQHVISAIRRGDEAGFKVLYDAYIKRIYNFVYRLVDTREDAEDIVQETFILAFNQIKELKDPARFDSWIYRIARNQVYQRFRRNKGSEISLDDEEVGLGYSLTGNNSGANPLDNVLKSELGRTIDRVLTSLPFKLKEVLVLAVINQLSYEQISRVVGRSVLSVKSDIHRARVIAREGLKKYLAHKK